MNYADYARHIRDAALRRRIISVCGEVSELSFGEQESVSKILDYAQGQFSDLSAGRDSKNFLHVRDVLYQVLSDLHKLSEDQKALAGTPTGFSGVDKMLVGLGDTDLVLVGARPGMGKTAFALNIATNVAFSTKKKVCVFSLEMSADQLVLRMLASEALVDSYRLRSVS